MAILIDNRQQRHPIDAKIVEKTAQAILDALAYPDAELSVVLVSDPEIHALNRQYRGKDRPTNVLAFAMRDGEFGSLTPGLLGDVVISMDTLAREAADAGKPTLERFMELLIHGILHLVGFDHEASDTDAEKMEKTAGEILERLRSQHALGRGDAPENRPK